ncbi:MAG: hypothetical protein KDE03_03390 [Rhodobacteraceae bacterium]|nr:hypothetical protein [Paracoccaceae bacterium]
MIRTGREYRDSIRDGREVCVNGERVSDVTTHPQFKPLADIRARIFGMAHEAGTRDIVTVTRMGEVNAVGDALPYSQADWWASTRTCRDSAVSRRFSAEQHGPNAGGAAAG